MTQVTPELSGAIPAFLTPRGKEWDAGSETQPIPGSLHLDNLAVDSPSSRLHPLPNPTMTQQWRSVMTENAQNPAVKKANENPDKPTIMAKTTSEFIGKYLLLALQKAKSQTDLIGDLVNITQQWVDGEVSDNTYGENLKYYATMANG